MKVSVIIPALNEARCLRDAILSVGGLAEVIVSDGGSTDSTGKIALDLGARILKSGPGRGLQMDAGAREAGGDILLFLHADTLLPKGWLEPVIKAVSAPENVAGAFSFSVGSEKRLFRLLERIVNFRARRLGLIYGDQAIFVKKESFFAAGGFRKLPLMEDVDCVMRLGKLGKVVVLDESVTTSPRRWDERGVIRNSARNLFFLSLFFLGVSPRRLYNRYYDR